MWDFSTSLVTSHQTTLNCLFFCTRNGIRKSSVNDWWRACQELKKYIFHTSCCFSKTQESKNLSNVTVQNNGTDAKHAVKKKQNCPQDFDIYLLIQRPLNTIMRIKKTMQDSYTLQKTKSEKRIMKYFSWTQNSEMPNSQLFSSHRAFTHLTLNLQDGSLSLLFDAYDRRNWDSVLSHKRAWWRCSTWHHE